jgi:hypothetical protein
VFVVTISSWFKLLLIGASSRDMVVLIVLMGGYRVNSGLMFDVVGTYGRHVVAHGFPVVVGVGVVVVVGTELHPRLGISYAFTIPSYGVPKYIEVPLNKTLPHNVYVSVDGEMRLQ